eukprot:168165_1
MYSKCLDEYELASTHNYQLSVNDEYKITIFEPLWVGTGCVNHSYSINAHLLIKCDKLETEIPTNEPSIEPTSSPSTDPTSSPSPNPSTQPTSSPTTDPTNEPTSIPSTEPTLSPTTDPTSEPTVFSCWTVSFSGDYFVQFVQFGLVNICEIGRA